LDRPGLLDAAVAECLPAAEPVTGTRSAFACRASSHGPDWAKVTLRAFAYPVSLHADLATAMQRAFASLASSRADSVRAKVWVLRFFEWLFALDAEFSSSE